MSTTTNLTAVAEAALSTQETRSENFGPFFIGLILDSLFLGLLIPLVITYYLTTSSPSPSTRSRRIMTHTSEGFLSTEPSPMPPGSGPLGVGEGKKDGWLTKSVVGWAMGINVVITLVIWRWNYDLFIYNFANYTRIYTQRYQAWMYILDSLCMAAVQSFYIHKAYILSQRKFWVTIVVSSLILTELGGGVALTIEYSQLVDLTHADSTMVIVTEYIWMVSAFLGNASITGVLIIFLMNARTGWSRTDKITAKLIRVVFESQLLPALLALGLVVQYTAKKDSFYNIPFLCCQAKIYAIGLMYTLNSRTTRRRDVNAMTAVSKLELKKEIIPMKKIAIIEPEPDKVHVQVDTYVYSQSETPYLSHMQTTRTPQFRDTKSTHKDEEDLEDFDDNTSIASLTLVGTNGYSSDTRLHSPDL